MKIKNFKITSSDLLILMLTGISTWLVLNNIIIPERMRIEAMVERIATGHAEAPFQYRILYTGLIVLIQSLLKPFISSANALHSLSFAPVIFLCFLGIFIYFNKILRLFFNARTAIIGLLLMQVVIPLTITPYYIGGDYITLLFYCVGFYLIFTNRDQYLPLLIGLGTLNRDQIVFLLIFYVIYLYSRRILFTRRSILILIFSTASFALVFLGLHWYYGFLPSKYTVAFQLENNTDLFKLVRLTLPIWLANVAVLFLLAVQSYRKSHMFLKGSMAALALYFILFAMNGNLWEQGKFLPALLILIPMSLQRLTGEKITFFDNDLKEDKNS